MPAAEQEAGLDRTCFWVEPPSPFLVHDLLIAATLLIFLSSYTASIALMRATIPEDSCHAPADPIPSPLP